MASKEVCGVSGCGQEAVRSVALSKAKEALSGLTLNPQLRRVHLCKEHYRTFRKRTRKEREFDRLAW